MLHNILLTHAQTRTEAHTPKSTTPFVGLFRVLKQDLSVVLWGWTKGLGDPWRSHSVTVAYLSIYLSKVFQCQQWPRSSYVVFFNVSKIIKLICAQS